MIKIRPKLPPEYQKLYVEQYKANRGGKTTASRLSQFVESWMHRKVAKDSSSRKSTLEVGAGNLNHLKYENVGVYDIVEPFKELYADSEERVKIRYCWDDISDALPILSYDRIISIATLEHVDNLLDVVARMSHLLSSCGVVRIAIPNEGSWLWTLGWKLTTGLEFRLRHGLDYGILMRHEHLNTADEIEEMLRYYFPYVSVKYFGFGKHFSLYRFYECRFII